MCCRHEYPQWRPQDLSRVFPTLEESGLELLRAMLQYDPARRISVSNATTQMLSCAQLYSVIISRPLLRHIHCRSVLLAPRTNGGCEL
jgi:hypothetical protein